MQIEFEYNMQLAQAQSKVESDKLNAIENRKDDRTKIQATQQSELIDQRKNNGMPKNFESAGNDVLGGFDLGGFEPQ